MDADHVATLRTLLSKTGWLERVRVFGRALRVSTKSAGGLLVVGTPSSEPWHLTAHLDEESRLAGIPELMPTLVRWAPPPGAPPHLSVGLSRLEAARRGETLFIVSEETAPVPLLERVNDARHVGATILALDCGDAELDALAHETLAVPRRASAVDAAVDRTPGAGGAPGSAAWVPPPAGVFDEAEWARRAGLITFDAAQHLVSAAAGEQDGAPGAAGAAGAPGARGKRGGLRDRLARLLDAVSGPTA